jgi:hypothetical protein
MEPSEASGTEARGTEASGTEASGTEPHLSKQTELNEAKPNRTERKSLIQFME